ncbi:SusC/RagA family TonB-linked outer membrane protein [Chryseolinea soli]|uniref:TonB-dependent receptor n=1 Tax=Chryseolinea soli TaxID=2321403 RepID=A0A385SLB6_9BACT|nr:TonB-dependent receptor [Chryseolinea soli]AYB32553.1 TonB-dependent receptor [Chryseolinea soli]
MSKKFYRDIGLFLLTVACFLAATPAGFSSPAIFLVQQTKISGKVSSADGEVLPGVNVIIKGTNEGTVTDADGLYTINVPGPDATLVFSFIGFSPEEITVGNQTRLDVTMTPALEALSEIVVIGYGEVKKSDLTGSVSSVKAEELKAIPTTSFDQALQGRAAGVQVQQTSGQPGAEASIRIRGTSSITAANEPLYVIDGMLVNSSTADVTAGGFNGPRIGPLSAINPSDIESIEILKDASATAIYGSRGANGVILITTKRGKKGTSALNFESYYGVQQVSKQLDLLNASQFGSLVNEARSNAGLPLIYTDPQNLGTGTDWQKEIYRTAPIQNYQLSFTGGTEKTQYAISGGLFDQDGVVIGSDFRRYSFRTNINTEISKKLSVGTNLSLSSTRGNVLNTGLQFIAPGVIGEALTMNPILPVYDATQKGGYTYENTIGPAQAAQTGTVAGNPVAEARSAQALSTSTRILGNVEAKYKIIDGLVFKTSFGIDGVFSKDRMFQPSWLRAAQAAKGAAGQATLQGVTWLNENTLTYDKQLRGKDNLNVVVGYTLQEFQNESFGTNVFGTDDQLGYHHLGSASNPQAPYNSESKWSMVSYLGRAQYSLNHKYLFTVTGRVDGSSKFGAANKYAFFPSGAFAWRMSDESFMQGIEFLSDLKLKASLGTIGNQAINPYQSLPTVASYGQGVFNNGTTVLPYNSSQPQIYNNPNLKWETTRQFNAGFDAGFFDGRIQMTAEYYRKYTYDLLLNTPISSTTGFETTYLNVGNVENKGFDLEITTVNTSPSSALKWNTSLNVSMNQNEVTKLATDSDVQLGNGLILREGQPIGTFYGYVFDGIFQTDEEASKSAVFANQKSGASQAKAGDRKYKDIVPDGVIDDKDRTIIGHALPKYTWGLNNTLSFKNFTLNFFFQASQGNNMNNLNRMFLEDMNGEHNVLADAALNRWTPTNPSNEYPRALAKRTADVGTISSKFIEDASYIRLKNVNLAYNVPSMMLDRFGMRSLRIYVSATNLFTSTNYRGYDPEGSSYGTATAYPGIDQGRYPLTKTYLVGLNLGF